MVDFCFFFVFLTVALCVNSKAAPAVLDLVKLSLLRPHISLRPESYSALGSGKISFT